MTLLLSEVVGATLATVAFLLLVLRSQVRARRALEASESRARAVLAAVDEPFVTMDAAGVIASWNAPAERTFGWSSQEAVGRRLSDLIVPDHLREAHEQGLRHYLATGEGPVLNTRIVVPAMTSDGRTLTVELAVWTDTSGPEPFFHAFITDVSARVADDRALQRQAAQLDVLSRIAVAANQAETVDDVVRDVLAEVCGLTGAGLGHAYLLGEDGAFTRGVWHDPDPEGNAVLRAASDDADLAARRAGIIGQVLRTGGPHWLRDVAEEPGFVRVVEVTGAGFRGVAAFPVLVGSEVAGVLEFFTTEVREPDHILLEVMTAVGQQLGRVVERERARQALASARDSALEASRLKSAFVANTSHEIRTPMNGVLGMTELLLGTQLDRQQREYAETVRSSAQALLAVVNDVLDFSKIEAGRMELGSVRLAVRPTVNDAVDVVAEAALLKGLTLTVDVDDDVPVAAVGDPGRLRQVVVNLVGNAVKFTTHGSVWVRVALEQPPADDVVLRFTVTDTGPGVEPSRLQELFEAFSQADVSSTREHGGTGLGLAISRQLVELMGGRMRAESTPGVGSTFSFTVSLSRAVGPEPLAAAPRPAHVRTDRPLLLLVEDNVVNQRVATALLDRAGYRVDVASDGEQGVEAVTRTAYAAVLMDCQMPVMDGYAATRRLRELGHRLPVIALTAGAMQGDRERCLDAGMDDYLPKPVDPAQLAETLDRWVPPPGGPVEHTVRTPSPRTAPDAEPVPDGTGPGALRAGGDPGDVLDQTVVDSLRAMGRGRRDLLGEVVTLWLADAPGRLAAIVAAEAAGDLEAAGRAAHTLKGSSASLGAARLAEACRALDEATRAGDAASCRRLLPAVRLEHARATQAFEGLQASA